MAETAATVQFADGKAYERFMGRWSRLTGQVFIDWLGLPVGLRWLDVGCGTGASSESILARAKPREIVAFDPSPQQIAYARATIEEPRIGFSAADATAFAFPEKFDVATSALVLNFIPARDKAVANMARAVKPGGTVAAYVWDFADGRTVNRPLREAVAALDPGAGEAERQAMHADSTRPEALASLFRGAGLAKVATRALDIEAVYRDFDDFWDSNTGFQNPLAKYLSGLAPERVEQIKARLAEIIPRDGSPVRVPARAWAVRGAVPD